MPTYIYPLYT